MTQEQINTLRQEIVSVGRQIEILSGPEFADTVPEIGVAKTALEAYKAEAERQVAAYDVETRAAQATPTAPGQVNLQALTAAIQANPALQTILGALLQSARPAVAQ